MIVIGSHWTYKDRVYRVVALHDDKWSQDAEGVWVPTVEYEAESLPNVTFLRPYTDFMTKFMPRF